MQVIYSRYWNNRTIVYLCRNLDNLSRGLDYSELKQAIHIGILCNVPRGRNSGFYSKYMLMDVRTHKIYSDKLVLYMMDLKKVDEATDDDRKWSLDEWARLINAKTWEEAKMAAGNNEYVAEAANTMFLLNSDSQAIRRALERQDYINHERYIEKTIKEKDAKITELEAEIEKLKARLDAKSSKNNK